jgi:hypothetical protein
MPPRANSVKTALRQPRLLERAMTDPRGALTAENTSNRGTAAVVVRCSASELATIEPWTCPS